MKAFLFIGFILFLAACSPGDFGEEAAEVFLAEAPPGIVTLAADNIPISRASAARMIALAFSDPQSIDWADRIIGFMDTSPTSWYDRYINMAYSLGHFSGAGRYFHPTESLTLRQAQTLLDRINPNNPIRIQITEENENRPISYALWVDLFVQSLESMGGFSSFGLSQQNIIVLITPENFPNLPHGHIITDAGHIRASGHMLEAYIDQEIAILQKGNHLVAILGIYSLSPILQNAYIVESSSDSLSVFVGGAQRVFENFGAGIPAGSIADIRIESGRAEILEVFPNRIYGIVSSADNSSIAIENHGNLPLHPNFRIYDVMANNIQVSNISQLTIGYNVADFVLRDGSIAAAIISRRATPEHIRVLLNTTGFTSRIHPIVELTSAYGFIVYNGVEAIEFGAEERIVFSPLENMHMFDSNRISIIPNNAGTIQILSISRNWPGGQSPKYRGIIEISRREYGFVLVNQLGLEEYLYGVIPSEMPTSFGLVAAKVQAITARSYAYNQLFANRFHAYGANVDDSTASQVYNNIPETETSIIAVNETRGQLLTYNGGVVNANFFSTSAGHTANSSDVWINGDTLQFDRFQPPYLLGIPQYIDGNFGNLSIEANALAFFIATPESYDSVSPWFRWNFFASESELTHVINSNLRRVYEMSPHLVKTLQNGQFVSIPTDSIGSFISMEVISRGVGGNIRELLLAGSSSTVKIRTEYLIRHALAPAGLTIARHEADPVSNFFMLPSSFFAFEEMAGGLQFWGGGFGHGVGMSQHGVYGMVARGYSYNEILAHFYPGAIVR